MLLACAWQVLGLNLGQIQDLWVLRGRSSVHSLKWRYLMLRVVIVQLASIVSQFLSQGIYGCVV